MLDIYCKLYRFFCDKGALQIPDGAVTADRNIPPAAIELLKQTKLALAVKFCQLSPQDLLFKMQEFFAVESIKNKSFLAELSAEGLQIYAADAAGCFYAVQSFCNLIDSGVFRAAVWAEIPRGESGIKLYLPSPAAEGIADFKRIIDFAVRCKCSFVMLELGGALEYKTHPEINQAWIEYCRVMNEYPGKTLDVQNAFPWRKNSIHSENGGGSYLTQQLFAELAAYCRERFLEVIPEMPSLSHSDYILQSHPELAERPNDPFPDTCCPLNKEYHKLYFDLLDEVIELIRPQRINICHDEFYSMNLCDRCRGKDPAQLYAQDINTIAQYLHAKGVQPMIWGEKLLNSHWQNGEPIGGAAVPESDNLEALPAVYPAAGFLSEKLEIMHWYWTVDRKLDEVYAQKNYSYYFANLSPAMFKDWSKRIAAPFAAGTCVSNWGQTQWRTLQRNGVLYDLLYTSLLMWNDQFTEDDFEFLDQAVFQLLYNWNHGRSKNTLEVTHTVDTPMKFKYFFDGFLLDEKSFYLGEHIFTSSSGEVLRLPVIFGSNISNCNVLPERTADPEGLRDAWVYNLQHTEVSGECLKFTDDENCVWYTCKYDLPAGELGWQYKGFETAPGKDFQVKLKEYKINL